MRITIDRTWSTRLRVLVEDESSGQSLAAFATSSDNYERMTDELRVRVLGWLRASLDVALRTRFANIAKDQIAAFGDRTECLEHGIERSRCGCVATANDPIDINMTHRLLSSIIEEAARNTAASLLGMLEMIEDA